MNVLQEGKHSEVEGLIPMGPGYRVTGACTCGWHSHSKTFLQHIEEVEKAV